MGQDAVRKCGIILRFVHTDKDMGEIGRDDNDVSKLITVSNNGV